MTNPELSRTIFQKMWDGDAPSDTIFKSVEHGLFVTLDGHPASSGHSLVVTKEPVAEWLDLDPSRQFQAQALGIILSKHLVERLNPERVVRLTSGYGVPHYHDHYVPSYQRGDAARVFEPSRLEEPMDFEELNRMREILEFPATLAQQAEDIISVIAAKNSRIVF